MERIKAAAVGSGIVSSRWECVTHAARCGRTTLIHTLPYLPHASHTGGHLSGLAKREAGVYASVHPCALARRGANHLHPTPAFYSNSWLIPSKRSDIDRSVQLGRYSVAAAAAAAVVCVCVCLHSAYKTRGVSATDGVHTPSCHVITACTQTHYIQHLLLSRTVHWGCITVCVCVCVCVCVRAHACKPSVWILHNLPVVVCVRVWEWHEVTAFCMCVCGRYSLLMFESSTFPECVRSIPSVISSLTFSPVNVWVTSEEQQLRHW